MYKCIQRELVSVGGFLVTVLVRDMAVRKATTKRDQRDSSHQPHVSLNKHSIITLSCALAKGRGRDRREQRNKGNKK